MSEPVPAAPHWVHGDFNGLFGELLCLSHEDTVTAVSGDKVVLAEGMNLVAYDPDEEDGRPDPLVARGRVEPSPDWLSCRGSRWVLRLDAQGVKHWSDLDADTRAALLRA